MYAVAYQVSSSNGRYSSRYSLDFVIALVESQANALS